MENNCLFLPQNTRRKMEKHPSLLPWTQSFIMKSKDSPTSFSLFKQAKKRDEIIQLLRKQREERILVRLIVRHSDKSLGGAANSERFYSFILWILMPMVQSLLYAGGGAGHRHQIIWESLINQRYLQSVQLCWHGNGALVTGLIVACYKAVRY